MISSTLDTAKRSNSLTWGVDGRVEIRPLMAEPPLPASPPLSPMNLVRTAASALLVLAGVILLTSLLTGQLGGFAGDVNVYRSAAERLRDGGMLYAPSDPGHAFRYAPWWAFAWLPLLLMPRTLVEVGWVTLQAGAALYLLWPHRWEWRVLIFIGPMIAYPVFVGNVHALMLAGLAYGLPRRSGPLFIALAASLKAFPFLFILWYIGRRNWRMAAETVALTVFLVAPMLLYDLSAFGVSPGATLSLYRLNPFVWAAVAIVALLTAIRLARTRYGLYAAAVAVIASLPRMLFYDAAYALIGLVAERRGIDGTATSNAADAPRNRL